MTKPLMELNEQPKAVQQLFGPIGESELYTLESLKTRIRLLFDGEVLGGWANDSGNGQHWYVLENAHTRNLNPQFTSILQCNGFTRKPQKIKGKLRHYWLAKGPENHGAFREAIEELTDVPLS